MTNTTTAGSWRTSWPTGTASPSQPQCAKRSRPSADIVREVRDLVARGYKDVMLLGQNVNCYGKKLDGDVDFAEMVEKAVAASRQLAKRQLTWLRGWPDLHCLDIDDGRGSAVATEELLANCLKILKKSPIYKSLG